jgi:capsular polysaccharide biosynthesis protein
MQQLDIRTMFRLLLSKLRWVILAMVIGALIMGSFAYFLMPRKYTTGVYMYVSNFTDTANQMSTAYTHLNSSQWLAKTYVEILKDRSTLEQLRSGLSRGVTVQQLQKMISVQNIRDTAMLYMTVTTNDGLFAAEVCNALAEKAPTVLTEVVGAGSVKVIGTAPRGGQTSPNMQLMVILGLVAGAVIAVAIIFLRHLTDNTVKTEMALKERLDVPVLGVIPGFSTVKKGGKARG